VGLYKAVTELLHRQAMLAADIYSAQQRYEGHGKDGLFFLGMLSAFPGIHRDNGSAIKSRSTTQSVSIG
jgi:hypothetical protein